MDPRFKHPFTMMIAGPTFSGKSHFVSRFLRHLPDICDTKFQRILFCYGEWQEAYKTEFKVKNCEVEFREGLPNNSDYSFDNDVKKLLNLDDLMREASSNVIVDLFNRGSYHKNISVIFIT